jgi:hypothetical protein
MRSLLGVVVGAVKGVVMGAVMGVVMGVDLGKRGWWGMYAEGFGRAMQASQACACG